MGNRNFDHQKPRIDLVKQAALLTMGFPGGSVVKNPPAVQEMQVSGEGNGNPLQYPCLGNPKQQQLFTEEPHMLPPCGEKSRGALVTSPPPQDRPSLGGDWPGVVFFYFLVTDRKWHIMLCTLSEHTHKKKSDAVFKRNWSLFYLPMRSPTLGGGTEVSSSPSLTLSEFYKDLECLVCSLGFME